MALGPLLASTLKSAMRGTLNKHDTRATKLLEIIYDCLIGCMADANDVVKMPMVWLRIRWSLALTRVGRYIIHNKSI